MAMKTKQKRIGKGAQIVIAITLGTVLLIIAYVLAREFYPTTSGHLISLPRAQIARIEQVVQIYAITHNGKFPESLNDLIKGTSDTSSLLRKEDLLDSWGEPIGYECDGRTFIIRSSGPDREMGTEDDITN